MKLDDIPFVIKDINEYMPFISDKLVSVPNQFRDLPKNLFEHCEHENHKSNEKLISTIEEIAHLFPNNPLPKWMRHYQNKYFKADIIRDGFFKNPITADLQDLRNIGRQSTRPFIEFGNNNGAPLTAGDQSLHTNGWVNRIWAWQLSVGIVGKKYNQLREDIFTAAGNAHYGIYDDSSNPNNLQADTGSVAVASGFTTYYSVTEFGLNTTQMWFAHQFDTPATVDVYYKSGSDQYITHSYGSLLNPFGTPTGSATEICHSELSHT